MLQSPSKVFIGGEEGGGGRGRDRWALVAMQLICFVLWYYLFGQRILKILMWIPFTSPLTAPSPPWSLRILKDLYHSKHPKGSLRVQSNPRGSFTNPTHTHKKNTSRIIILFIIIIEEGDIVAHFRSFVSLFSGNMAEASGYSGSSAAGINWLENHMRFASSASSPPPPLLSLSFSFSLSLSSYFSGSLSPEASYLLLSFKNNNKPLQPSETTAINHWNLKLSCFELTEQSKRTQRRKRRGEGWREGGGLKEVVSEAD